MPCEAVISAMRSAPRSGQITPESTSRKCGATIRRSICSSVSLVSANTIQDGMRARFARVHLDAAHDAVRARRGRDLDAVALVGIVLDPAGQVDRLGVRRHAHGFHRPSRKGKRPATATSETEKQENKTKQAHVTLSREFSRGEV